MSNTTTQQTIQISPKERNIKIQMALISWTMIALITYFVIQPLFGIFAKPKYIIDITCFCVIFLAYIRYIFMLPTTFLAYMQRTKIVLIFLSIPLVFYTIQSVNDFESFFGDDGMSSFENFFVEGLSFTKQQEAMAYAKEVIFFLGVGVVFASLALSVRMLKSYWRVYNNTGTV